MEEKYRYASKKEQIRKANRFFTYGTAIFYAFVLGIVVLSCLQGIRTVGYTMMVFTLIAIIILGTVIMYARNKYDTKIRYIASTGLLVITFLVGVAFEPDYPRIMAAMPFVICIVFFDKKFASIYGGLVVALNIIVLVLKSTTLHKYSGMEIFDQACATVAIATLMFIIYWTVKIAYQFNADTIGQLREEKEAQDKMMQDVLAVAEEVREGTENAMELVNELNESTGVVNGAVKDISDSTQSTAENIQTQTVMTQNIQEAIGETLKHSEDMVMTAKKSEELNGKNMGMMEHLKQQSRSIAETNADVATTMQKLQEKTEAVKGIADTIFSISNQTNLLALNASIESARAGEAGRGFAVVADEIRQLAEKTRQETENIATILEELSNEAKNAAETVNTSVEAAGKQDELINEVSASFDEMNQNVNELTGDIAEIDKMLNQLSDSNNQIVDNITQLSATTEEVTASSHQAAELSVNNLEHAENAQDLLKNVMSVAEELKEYTK